MASAGTLTVSSGGILVTSAAGASAISGGTLEGASGQDLVVLQNSGSALTINSSIADNGNPTGLTLSGSGAGTVYLTAANSYSGPTTISTGILSVGNGGATGDLGNSSGVLLAGGSLTFNRTSNYIYNSPITSNMVAMAGTVTDSGTGVITLGGSNNINANLNINAGATLAIAGSTNVGNPPSNNTGWINLSPTGSGSALSTLEILQGGSLTQTSTAASLRNGNGNPYVGQGANSRAMVLVQGNGSVSLLGDNYFQLGSGTGATGAVYQSGANSSVTVGLGNGTAIGIGNGGSGSEGFYSMSGGTLLANLTSSNGDNIAIASGLFYQNGGYVNNFNKGAFAVSGGSASVYYGTGGTFIANGVSIGGPQGVFTVAGTLSMTVVNQYFNGNLTLGNGAGSTAILNLDGGTLATYQINPNATAGALYQVNFNGGTLMPYNSPKYGLGNPLVPSSPNYSAYIEAGGLTVNTGNYSTTIAQSLLAPSGSGVYSIAVTSSGSGYVAPPIVTISGSSGATAVANMVPDGTGNGTYEIGSITITSPGIGLTGTPTASLSLGGYTTAGALAPCN